MKQKFASDCGCAEWLSCKNVELSRKFDELAKLNDEFGELNKLSWQVR